MENGLIINKFDEFHTDDITQICIEGPIVVSAGMDGLINLYDLSSLENPTYDNADDQLIKLTINLQTSINLLKTTANHIMVATHIETFMVYTTEGTIKHKTDFKNIEFSSLKNNPYIVDIIEEKIVVADDYYLNIFEYCNTSNTLSLKHVFLHNNSSTIRSVYINQETIVSGDEKGCLRKYIRKNQ